MVRCTSPRWLRPTWATIHVTQMDMSNFFKPTLFKWMVSGSQKTTSVSFLSETTGCCDPKRTFLVINFIQFKPQTCSLHCWGSDQHESAQRIQQRVLTIPTHQVLLTDDTWATALFTRSIFFRSSRRGEPLLLSPVDAILHTGKKKHVWDLCDTVMWGCCTQRMTEQNSFS